MISTRLSCPVYRRNTILAFYPNFPANRLLCCLQSKNVMTIEKPFFCVKTKYDRENRIFTKWFVNFHHFVSPLSFQYVFRTYVTIESFRLLEPLAYHPIGKATETSHRFCCKKRHRCKVLCTSLSKAGTRTSDEYCKSEDWLLEYKIMQKPLL